MVVALGLAVVTPFAAADIPGPGAMIGACPGGPDGIICESACVDDASCGGLAIGRPEPPCEPACIELVP